MNQLADKVVLLGSGVLVAASSDFSGSSMIVWLLAAVTISALCGAFGDHQAPLVLLPAYLVAGYFSSDSVYGAPLIVHDLARAAMCGGTGTRRGVAICAVPLLGCLWQWHQASSLALAETALCVLSVLLAVRSVQAEHTRSALHRVRDDLQSKVTALQAAHARLLEATEYEARAGVMAERTRIARDMHDGVGHVLTRLLFRIKAMQVVHRDEPIPGQELTEITSGLEESLTAMRTSVHALSDDGEDLATALHLLAAKCGIPDVDLDYGLEEEPPVKVARCIIAVVTEALTNAVRHGQASTARVQVIDYPAFWRIVVGNDGNPPEDWDATRPQGLGLQAMTDRVEALGGKLRIVPRPRFTILATIPKDNR